MTRRRELAICTAIALAVLAIYGQTLGFEFVGYDDDAYVLHNPVVSQGLTAAGLRWALTATTPANWHPLTLYSHMLDVELFGLDPAGHHGVAVVLHLINSLLVFAVVRSATGAPWRSALVAALFAVHPLHVEAVAWVSQRKTLLSTGFGLIATGAYLSWTRRGGAWRYAACTLALVLGLAAKSMLVTLPLLLLLLDVWPLARLREAADLLPRLREKLPLFAAVVAVGVVTVVAQSGFDAVAPWSLAGFIGSNLPNAANGVSWYLGKLFLPVGLAVHYPHPDLAWAGGMPLHPVEVLWAVCVIALVSSAVVWARRVGWAPFGWLWFLIALAPVSGLVQVGSQAMADRYAYGPFIGLFVLIAWGLEALRRHYDLRVGAVSAAALLFVTTLGIGAARQAMVWRDSRTLYTRALEVNPNDTAMLFNLGNAMLGDGERVEAERIYRVALSVHPGLTPAQLNLAELLRERGEFAEAIELHRKVLVARPRSQRAQQGLGRALRGSTEPGRSGVRVKSGP